MLKKIRKLISLLMAGVLIMLLCMPSVVGIAEAAQIEELAAGLVMESENALCSVRGTQAPDELSNSLKNYDITIKDDTLIEVFPATTDGGNQVLAVTNTNGAEIEKTLVMSYGEVTEIYEEDYTGGSWEVEPFNDSFVLLMMVSYNMFETDLLYSFYYQPVNVMFIYYEPNQAYIVENITVDYMCWGFEFEIDRNPVTDAIEGYTALTSGMETYEHHIIIDRDSPNRRTYYSGNNPYNTERAIDPNVDMFGSHIIHFEADLVRVSDHRSIHLDQVMEISQLI